MHWSETIVFFLSASAMASAFTFPIFTSTSSYLQIHRTFVLRSSIGGSGDDDGNNNKNPPGNKSPLDDFLDPRKAASESENLKRAREKISEAALPINFDNIDISTDSDIESDIESETIDSNYTSSQGGKLDILSNATTYANNPYLNVVAKLSPSDLISKFTSTAHPRVQDAVRNTILGLIGSLPKMAFETTTITTGERLASLMFQLQMTGYLFKNAEYRLSLSQSLGMTSDSVGKSQSKFLLKGEEDNNDDADEEESLSTGKVKGKIKISYSRPKFGGANDDDQQNNTEMEPSMEVEVDAAAYMAELRDEVKKLREDLSLTRKNNEDAIRKDLLLYIKTLPPQELQTLTNTMSPEVMAAMKGLVNVVMSGIGDGKIDKNTVTEQSGEAMAQLCMWQLVVGYNLRELEVRQEMKNALQSAKVTNLEDDLDNGYDSKDMGSFE